ncbi:HNH endonuclease [Streptomyces venezuelae]|uniref:HNH endonuclease n=1 Tax=Streptomyces venezuelae TaxID=54571 RepID=UPI0016800AB1|nr:HNH endonuclease [Streptomyces venezuelae]
MNLVSASGAHVNRRLNRLICEAFHGAPPSPLHQAAHLNGVRTDNRADNLAWKTQRENEEDKDQHGTRQEPRRGEQNSRAKLTDANVQEIRRRYAEGGVTQQALSELFGVSSSIISGVIRGQRWTHVRDDGQ